MDKDKSSTLPRKQRDVSPTPSSSSFASFKSVKIPLMRRKKKKNKEEKKNKSLSGVLENNSSAAESATEASDYCPSPVGTPSSPTLSPAASPSLARAQLNGSGKSLKSQKKSKETLKSIIKGGKNLITFKGKNESAPVMVEPVLDIRRIVRSKEDEEDSDKTDHEPNEVFSENLEDKAEVKNANMEEEADYDWSISSTYARMKKLSIAETRESVYEEVNDEEVVGSLPTTPEVQEDMVEKQFSATLFSSSNGPDALSDKSDQSSNNIEKKSPNTIRREILQITRTRKGSEHTANVAVVRNRKISLQARSASDKNELLFKILVIGELGTGKTSIIKRYVHQFFSQHYRATIGVDFALKVLPWDDNTTIRLQLWDIAGQERFGNMTRVYYKEAVGAFIVFDVTRVSTFEAVSKWKQDLDSKVQLPDGGPIPCVLLANKCDQPKEGTVNNPVKMDEFCKENKFIAWFETSAKDNVNIDEAAHCLVTKIVQNDQKRQEEKEVSNGVSAHSKGISLDGSMAEHKKSCAC